MSSAEPGQASRFNSHVFSVRSLISRFVTCSAGHPWRPFILLPARKKTAPRRAIIPINFCLGAALFRVSRNNETERNSIGMQMSAERERERAGPSARDRKRSPQDERPTAGLSFFIRRADERRGIASGAFRESTRPRRLFVSSRTPSALSRLLTRPFDRVNTGAARLASFVPPTGRSGSGRADEAAPLNIPRPGRLFHPQLGHISTRFV